MYIYLNVFLIIKQKEGVKMTGTKEVKKEEEITSPSSIADNIANEVKKVLDRHANETIEVKKYAYGHDEIINVDTYKFSISSREKDSVSMESSRFGTLHVAIFGDNSIGVRVNFDYVDIPLRYRYGVLKYDPNRTNPYSALKSLVGDLGETIKKKEDGFKTAKRYQINISTYDEWGDPMKEGSYHYESYENNTTRIRQ